MKLKALGNLYDIPTRSLTLGDQRTVKREFGFVPGSDAIDWNDPDHVGAFLYWTMREHDPDQPPKGVLAAIERVRDIEFVGDDGEPLTDEDADPTPARAKKTKPKPAADEDASD